MPGELGNKRSETEMIPKAAQQRTKPSRCSCDRASCWTESLYLGRWRAMRRNKTAKWPPLRSSTAVKNKEKVRTSALFVHYSKKINDRLIFPRPFGVCPSAFAIACCDIILTTRVRYTAVCVY